MLPETTEEVVAIVKLANRLRTSIIPQAGATGLNDGAKPNQGGIVVDTKRMNKVLEVDTTDWTVTIQPSINMLKLNQYLAPHGVWYPDDPASYPVSIVSGRIGTGSWSLLGSRYGTSHDNVISLEVVTPHRRGGRGRPGRRPQDPPLLDRFPPQGPLPRPGTWASPPRPPWSCTRGPRPSSRRSSATSRSRPATGPCNRSAAPTWPPWPGVILFDERKVGYLRRDDEAAASPSRSRSSRSWPWPPTAPRARSRPPATG